MNPGTNNIEGVGTDVIEIERIKCAIQRHGSRLLTRLFTPEELAYCQRVADPSPRLAGRFAAKEAVVKALGTGFREGITWTMIEILNDPLGKPQVTLQGYLQACFPNTTVLLSISHCRAYATAMAIAVTPNHESKKK